MSGDYYKILGIEKNASKEDIKKAYKKLAKKYHPDISQESSAETKFKEINEAAGVLLDDEKKQRYDTYGTEEGSFGFGGGGGFDPRDFGINLDDIFEQFGFGSGFGGGFGGFGGGSRTHRPKRDMSIYIETEIDLDDIYFGAEREITISREEKCETCNGKGAKDSKDISDCSKCNGSGMISETKQSLLGVIRTQTICPMCKGSGNIISNPCRTCSGRGAEKIKDRVEIKIPKGIENGVTLRVSDKGNYDKDSNSYGDLYIKIHIRDSKDYSVDGADLHRTININFISAIIGDEVEIEHFDKTLSVEIPQGTQPDTILRLKGKGLPHFNYTGKGDLYIKINIEMPKKTTKEQKKILMEYAKTLDDKSILDKMKSLFR